MGRDLNSRPPVCETGILTILDNPSSQITGISITKVNCLYSTIGLTVIIINIFSFIISRELVYVDFYYHSYRYIDSLIIEMHECLLLNHHRYD